MNPRDLLALAPKTFDDTRAITCYTPLKIKDKAGFQYLFKGEPKSIRGSIHQVKDLQENPFGTFNAENLVLSTQEALEVGALIEWNNSLYAISKQTSFNKVLDLKHYLIQSAYDYYLEFIIDDKAKAERILGANSMRYLLAIKSQIPIIPHLFKPNKEKYIAVHIQSTQAISMPFLNKAGIIEQQKKDYARFYALGLDTNELQDFILGLQDLESVGLVSTPFWKEDTRFDEAFDLKANLQICECWFYYNLETTLKKEHEKLITQIGFTLIP